MYIQIEIKIIIDEIMKNLLFKFSSFIVILFIFHFSFAQQILQWDSYSAYFRINCMIDLDTAVLAGTEFNGLVSINKNNNQVYYITSTNSGFTGNRITGLARDASGQIWAGSDCGLSCYSGGNWTLYTSQNSPLPINSVTALRYSTNMLLVGLLNGTVIKIDTSGWHQITGQNGIAPTANINSLVTDGTGNIWAGTMFDGAYMYDGINWIHYNSGNSTLTNFIKSMAVDHAGNVWVATTWKLSKFDGTSWSLYNPSSAEMIYISVDTNSVVWCSTLSGVRTFNGTSWNYLPFNSFLSSHQITCHLWDKNYFWTGYYDKGVDHITLYNNSVVNYPLIPELIFPYVNTIDFDAGGNDTWFGIQTTWDGGYSGKLSHYDGTVWNHYHALNSSLLSNNVKTICTDTNNTIWIGTADTGLYRLHGNNWSHYTPINSGIYGYNITALGKDCGNGLLIGFEDGTVQTLQNNSFQTIIYKYQVNSAINKILTDNNGITWIATESTGLLKYVNSNLILYNTSVSGIPSNHISDIKTDTLYHLWIATNAGIVYYDCNLSWVNYNTSNSGIPDNDISALTVAPDNSLWIGTHFNGLVHYDGNSWNSYEECNSPLIGDNILEMKTSSDGSIYIGTNRGVTLVKYDVTTGYQPLSASIRHKVYPNPGSYQFTFSFQTEGHKNYSFRIYGTLGDIVFEKDIVTDNCGNTIIEWDISSQVNCMNNGCYYYNFSGGGKFESGKVVILR